MLLEIGHTEVASRAAGEAALVWLVAVDAGLAFSNWGHVGVNAPRKGTRRRGRFGDGGGFRDFITTLWFFGVARFKLR